jgi:hypothetical protein
VPKRGSLILTVLLALAVGGVLMLRPNAVRASDHDDGETSTKGRNVNLTDLYVFREVDQQNQIDGGNRTFGGPTDPSQNIVFVMNTNPRSLPRQQYFFSNAPTQYTFFVKRVSGVPNSFSNISNGIPDLSLTFTFGAPTAASNQSINLTRTFYSNGTATTSSTVGAGTTTAAIPGLGTPQVVSNNVAVTSNNATDSLTVFAGLREDPFFFDVTQYFRVRAGALGLGPAVGFRSAASAIDFTKDYNVNSIVVRMPLAFLQRNADGSLASQTAFDVWQEIFVQQ